MDSNYLSVQARGISDADIKKLKFCTETGHDNAKLIYFCISSKCSKKNKLYCEKCAAMKIKNEYIHDHQNQPIIDICRKIYEDTQTLDNDVTTLVTSLQEFKKKFNELIDFCEAQKQKMGKDFKLEVLGVQEIIDNVLDLSQSVQDTANETQKLYDQLNVQEILGHQDDFNQQYESFLEFSPYLNLGTQYLWKCYKPVFSTNFDLEPLEMEKTQFNQLLLFIMRAQKEGAEKKIKYQQGQIDILFECLKELKPDIVQKFKKYEDQSKELENKLQKFEETKRD
ncbi:UNKNOWN [Stylonychia lemnae]|uniref:Uncharacterized protein n=1 Tax=Stylonychia lemnae TaxID=5949 RepID=A0A078AQN4_STYLE|nr:UNKNOWN [Stylonychia lemnae]|eukprot:CDW83218.1 UNKNOWN [Stylonychia lemnae]